MPMMTDQSPRPCWLCDDAKIITFDDEPHACAVCKVAISADDLLAGVEEELERMVEPQSA